MSLYLMIVGESFITPANYEYAFEPVMFLLRSLGCMLFLSNLNSFVKTNDMTPCLHRLVLNIMVFFDVFTFISLFVMSLEDSPAGLIPFTARWGSIVFLLLHYIWIVQLTNHINKEIKAKVEINNDDVEITV